ncbi:MAG: 50S ribosomal protein L25 [Desulfuromonas sp.]|nr:MAG: 50S ribosomal protein L25 [Desulfuromonas sp.]
MAKSELQVMPRKEAGKGVARSLRREGLVPAVVYGKGMDPCSIAVDPKALKTAIGTEAGWNTLITLKGDGPFDGKVVLLKDMQVDAIRRDILHADFNTIDLKKKIHVMVPVQALGTPKGVKEGGTLSIVRHELEVICLPTDIPKSIDVDVTELDVADVVHVDDLEVAEGVEIPHDVNFTILTVVGRMAEEVEEVEGEEVEGEEVAEEAAEEEAPTEEAAE